MRIKKHTDKPWDLWRGPRFVGGGEDICIGAGKNWLANMDHREPKCDQIMSEDHHDDESCPICSIDSDKITEEQLANAKLMQKSPDMYDIMEGLFYGTMSIEKAKSDIEKIFNYLDEEDTYNN